MTIYILNDTFRTTLSDDSLDVTTHRRTRLHTIDDSSRQGTKTGETRVDMNRVEVARDLAVRLVSLGRVESGGARR